MLDVARWLAEQGLVQYSAAFVENAIDSEILRTLSEDDSRNSGSKRLATAESFSPRSPYSTKSRQQRDHQRTVEHELSNGRVSRSGGS
jgi:hypothetical protein